jgi:uncharacterized membrane protein
MRLTALVKGLPGHPLHPPLTDVTVGAYAVAAVAAILDVTGAVQRDAASAWWVALVVGLCSTVLTASTGFVDWIELDWGSAAWRTATAHLTAMLAATGLFVGAALAGHGASTHGDVDAAGVALTLAGFAVLAVGGWLGGAVVFVHGKRVLAAAGRATGPEA